MDKISLLSFILVSLPEGIIGIIMISLIVGRFELVKFNFGNIIKILTVSTINEALIDIIKTYSNFYSLNLALNVVCTAILCSLVLKINWYEVIVAHINVSAFMILLETAIIIFAFYVHGIEFHSVLKSDYLRGVISIPIRIIEVLVIIFLCKLPIVIIDLKPFKYAKLFIKKFSHIAVCLFLGIVIMFNTIKLVIFDLKLNGNNWYMIEYMLVNLVFVIAVFGATIYMFMKSKRNFEQHKKEYLDAISYIDYLLRDENNDISRAKKVISSEKSRWIRRSE